MSCTVAISNSPVFSPRVSKPIPFLYKLASSTPTSTENLIQMPQSSNLIRASSTDCSTSGSTVLKRKRPSRLDVPLTAPTSFQNIPATPAAVVDLVEVDGDGYSVCCKKGRKSTMEDRYSADSKKGIFGIFDGHGGAKAAEFAAENLNNNITKELENSTDGNIEEAVKKGYLKTDSDFLSQELRGGSCSVTALIKNGNLVISNAGDCRGVVSRGGVAEALTSDHKPSRKDEKERIEALGGYVDYCNGTWRIQGSLAVSRGIGDRYLKQWVTAEPETRILELNPELEFLILGSDGLWDKVSNQEAVDIAKPLCTDITAPQPLSVCRKLIDLSVSRGSVDDISVMIIQLGQFC